MNEEDFLARWSRRKREVAKVEAEPHVEPQPVRKEPSAEAVQEVEPEFDVASSAADRIDQRAHRRDGVPARREFPPS